MTNEEFQLLNDIRGGVDALIEATNDVRSEIVRLNERVNQEGSELQDKLNLIEGRIDVIQSAVEGM